MAPGRPFAEQIFIAIAVLAFGLLTMFSGAFMSIKLVRAYRSDAWGPRTPEDLYLIAQLLLRYVGMFLFGLSWFGLLLGLNYDPRLVAVGPLVIAIGMIIRPIHYILRKLRRPKAISP